MPVSTALAADAPPPHVFYFFLVCHWLRPVAADALAAVEAAASNNEALAIALLARVGPFAIASRNASEPEADKKSAYTTPSLGPAAIASANASETAAYEGNDAAAPTAKRGKGEKGGKGDSPLADLAARLVAQLRGGAALARNY
ncbi:hypothetical protein T492DRAFT_850802 [Pavlovales sp. CCMP2436]|nr:hypothetical protein T492DRAFT_850802 [Pavlovales sp. CCMP2436]